MNDLQIILKDGADGEGGEAELRAKRLLNCEKRKNYKFDITAVSCHGQTSNKYGISFLYPFISDYITHSIWRKRKQEKVKINGVCSCLISTRGVDVKKKV